MKKILKLVFVLSMFVSFLNSCSKDDENNSSQIDTRYAKKWYIGTKYFTLPNGGSCENNYYHLKSNGTIEYKYWGGGPTCEYDVENGTWKIENNKLIKEFPSDPGTNNGITLQNEIISVSNTELKLKHSSNGSTITYYNYE